MNWLKGVAVVLLMASFPFLARAEGGVVVASGAMGWRPYLMQDARTGEVSGVLHDVLARACENLGYEMIFAEYPWKRALDNLLHGDVDVICGIYKTKNRVERFRYSGPVFKDEIRVFVTDPFPMEGLEDLVGKEGDRPLGGSYGDRFDSYARRHLYITEVTTKELSFSRLLRGHIDYYVCAYADCMHYITQEGLEDRVQALPYVISTNEVYFAFSRKSAHPERDAKIIAELERLRQDGTVDAIFRSYCSTVTP